jgi:hypothetical protein
MAVRQLGEAILDGGRRSVNFFNGRLLSAEDLSQEQTANQDARRALGQTGGEGIAYGLEVVRPSGFPVQTPVVTVKPGLAVNRRGCAIYLPDQIDLALTRPTNPEFAIANGFSDCVPLQPGVYLAGVGVYLLVMMPARGTEGRAAVSGLGNAGANCGVRYNLEGVQFRLVTLNLGENELIDEGRLQNNVAYDCFGVADAGVQSFAADPFGTPLAGYGLLDGLRFNGALTDCDIPLAVVEWTVQGLGFIDRWAVRRRLTRPSPTLHWPLLMGERRMSEAEAMFLQFEEQIEAMRLDETGLNQLRVTDRFTFLPSAGLLPVIDDGSPSGFDVQTFFGDFASNDIAITDGRLLRQLMQEALFHDPIDLRDTEKIQLYLIYDNLQAVTGGQTSQLALVFASSALPYRGVARFHAANWNLSRFASMVI